MTTLASRAEQEMNQIELSQVGPIEQLRIPVPEGGGVVVLKGRNGSGKSHALAGVESLYSKGVRRTLRNRDGSTSGSVSGLGVDVRLGRSNTVRGELVCESLDGRVDPSILVDPGLKDPVKADSKRLESLVRLGGVKVPAGQWETAMASVSEMIAIGDMIEDDPVVTADRIRRRVHEQALLTEKLAKSKAAESSALVESVADVADAVSSESDLDAELDAATAALAKAQSVQRQYVLTMASQSEAQKSLDVLGTDDGTDSPEDELGIRVAQADGITNRIADTREAISLLQTDLAKLIESEKAALLSVASARELVDAAKSKRDSRVACLKVLSESLPEYVSRDDIATLENRKNEAKAAIRISEVVRRAAETRSKAELLREDATSMFDQAEDLRTLARSTDAVLEAALIDAGFDVITVHDGRLCVDTDRGKEPFSELSHGERWRLALDLAAAGMPPGSVLPVCQEAFEALDPDNRQAIHGMAIDRGLVILTAEASSGDLRAEVFGGAG